MAIRLPNELILEIYSYLPLEQVIADTETCFPILKKLHFSIYNKIEYPWNCAISKGNLEVLKLFHEYTGCTKHTMDWACFHGHMNIVKWIHQNSKEGCTARAMDWAAQNGHFDVVKFLHENRKEGCTLRAMDYSEWNGHIEILKFLKKEYSHVSYL